MCLCVCVFGKWNVSETLTVNKYEAAVSFRCCLSYEWTNNNRSTRMNELNYKTRVMVRISARALSNGCKFQHLHYSFGLPRKIRELCKFFSAFLRALVMFFFELIPCLTSSYIGLFVFLPICFCLSCEKQKLWIVKQKICFLRQCIHLKVISVWLERLCWCVQNNTIWNDNQTRQICNTACFWNSRKTRFGEPKKVSIETTVEMT